MSSGRPCAGPMHFGSRRKEKLGRACGRLTLLGGSGIHREQNKNLALRCRMSARETLLRSLRHAVAGASGESRGLLSFGVPPLDAALGGGLRTGLHEIAPQTALHLGAASGLALALAIRCGGEALWIQQ